MFDNIYHFPLYLYLAWPLHFLQYCFKDVHFVIFVLLSVIIHSRLIKERLKFLCRYTKITLSNRKILITTPAKMTQRCNLSRKSLPQLITLHQF
jgi:hypothetical protein